ncbi:MAG: hydrogenase maturation protease [Planctomycetes bacterium]|nr:hydrogenase maturation protease [Planctomycetota bacterium]
MSTTLLKKKVDKSRGSIMIVGVGNRLLGDEGVGLHIIDSLSRIPMPSYVKIIDCGCDLLSLMAYLNKPQKVLVIDAIRAGGKPGQVYRFDFDELHAVQNQMHSAHQVKTADALELLKHVCPCLTDCEITVMGIEPKAIELSTDLSKEVGQSVSDLTRLVLEEISLPTLAKDQARK